MAQVVADMPHEATSWTEQIVVDPLLLAGLPVPVNELTQEIFRKFLHL